MNENMYTVLKDKSEYHWYLMSKRELVLALIKMHKFKSFMKVADFGCGAGLMLEDLKILGELTGYDQNEDVLNHCRKKHCGVNFVLSNIASDDKIIENSYDVAVALDILEHIEDDGKAVKNIYNSLGINGFCVFTVPALELLWSKFDENLGHKRRYNKKQLVTLLQNAGFEIDYIGYYNFWFFPAILTIRLVSNIFHLNSESKLETNIKNNFINKLCYTILSSEVFFIANKISLPIGVSLICLARKKLPSNSSLYK